MNDLTATMKKNVKKFVTRSDKTQFESYKYKAFIVSNSNPNLFGNI